MSQKIEAEKVVLDADFSTAYAVLIEQGESANLAGLEFILDLNERMENGLTQVVAEASMRAIAKGVGITPSVRASHVSSIKTASAIITKFEREISDVKVSRVLTLAVRVLADVKAQGVSAHLEKFSTIEELDKGIFDPEGNLITEGTLTKAESQARDKGEQLTDEIEVLAEAVSYESAVDGFLSFMRSQNLKELTTTEIEKTRALIGALMQVEKNSKKKTA